MNDLSAALRRATLRVSSLTFLLAPVALLLAAFSAGQSVCEAQAPHPLSANEKQRVETLIGKMTLAQKIDYIGGTGFAVRGVPELNLPPLEMSDGPYGVRSNFGFPSTTYAAGIGLAASWDRALAAQVGAGIGRDARARGVNYMLGPGTNIYRSPLNGRNFEYFGEDPYLAGQIVTGYVTGMQQQGVSATVKHYVGNNSEYLRHDSDSVIDERTLREIYLPAFEAAVRQGHVGAIMDSYNFINGAHATQNGYLNIDIARKDWGFQGTLMSDWDATYDGVAAANNGLDLEMPIGKFMNQQTLEPAVQSGAVKESVIDEKIRHILTTAMMFGWLDRPQRDPSISVFDAESNRVALESAREAAVLLKNEGGLLPLNPDKVKTVLLVGPDAYPGAAVGGGSAGVVPFQQVSLLEGIAHQAPGIKVLYDAGVPSLSNLAMQTNFVTAETGGAPGVIEETFPSLDLSGTPVTATVAHINRAGIGWDAISGDLMALFQNPQLTRRSRRDTGYFNAASAGNYMVAFAGGGEGTGDRILIDGQIVFDDWKLTKAIEPHVVMPLAAGLHKVVVETRQDGLFGDRARLALVPESALVTERSRELATQADVIVVAAGFSNTKDFDSESEGSDRTFDLPYGQDELIAAMAAANPKTVVLVTSGGNVHSTRWIERVPALIEGFYGGQAGGEAQAEILFGKTNPSGHLPVTFERHAEDNPAFHNYYPDGDSKRVVYREGIFVGYRGYEKNRVTPLFPFGFGLSYTSFQFSKLTVKPGTGAGFAEVDFDVKNTGRMAGAEVAQVYVGDPETGVPQPVHQLKGFERVMLAPGETRHVSIELDARAFAYYDVALKQWTIPPGRYRIEVGDSVATLPLSGSIELDRQKVAEAKF
jgi:beta-glucosidase